ncbi:MAG: Gldg family protein [Deltaproteobacteria bacterium]|nr:Gldg family protein [Deltaproteobacteria bacterium]
MKKNPQFPQCGPCGRYGKVLLYVLVVVLINLVGVNLFTRFDLTANRVYSLSPVSREVVATLSEPLTFKVFFSANLPAPYNGVERYVHDLLQEYALAGNQYFNYQFYNPGGDDEAALVNQEQARSYGITPVQIRAIEQDEVKFQKAYMGLVMIHGDLVETLPAITSTEGLEYRLTTAIKRMNNKISRLLALPEKVKIELFLSSSLQAVGPYLNLKGLEEVPRTVAELVGRLNGRLYDRLDYEFIDPSTSAAAAAAAVDKQVMELKWKEFRNRQGQIIPEDHGYAGLRISLAGESRSLPLISAVKVPIFGTQYIMASVEELEEILNVAVEDVIGINEKIGYLSSHGTLPLEAMAMPGQPHSEAATHFNVLLSREYAPEPVSLEKMSSLTGIRTLIIARPTEKFSDYELYLLDQFLLRGNKLAVFYDPFDELMPSQQQMMMGQGPSYAPVQTGLEKLLAHHGVKIKPAYVLDQECFKQQLPQNQGGGEQPIYFAPLIQSRHINKDYPFISNIKGLVMLKAAPLELDVDALKARGLTATRLFSSSEKSWLMQGRIDLNPMFMQPPAEADAFASHTLAALLEGSFGSYFSGQPLPEKPAEKTAETQDEAENQDDSAAAETQTRNPLLAEGLLESHGERLETGRPGALLVVGSADILRDNIVDEAGATPNAQLLMNMIDYLNGREDQAVMRSKTQSFNPLAEISPESRALIKGANLIGLPLLVVLAGIMAWLKRGARRRKLKQMFS